MEVSTFSEKGKRTLEGKGDNPENFQRLSALESERVKQASFEFVFILDFRMR